MTRLFDCQCGFGGTAPGVVDEVPRNDLAVEMDRLGIATALARTLPDEMNRDVTEGNRLLYETCDDDDRLVPCPVLVPALAAGRAAHETLVAEAIDRGARAAFLRPPRDHWSLHDWCCGEFLGALEAARLPAFVLERDVSLSDVADVALRHPNLRVILAGVGYRSQRELVPLLRARPRVHLSVGSNYCVHYGIEQLVDAVGPERLLFGSGFPGVEPALAATMLAYAEVADDQKAMIGSGNLERLVGEVVA
jgi:hypothetical protein